MNRNENIRVANDPQLLTERYFIRTKIDNLKCKMKLCISGSQSKNSAKVVVRASFMLAAFHLMAIFTLPACKLFLSLIIYFTDLSIHLGKLNCFLAKSKWYMLYLSTFHEQL